MDRIVKEVVSRLVIAISPRQTRYSIKVHKEATKEAVLAKLMTYGIPVQFGLPLSSSRTGGITKTASHKQWLAKQREREESYAKDVGITWNLTPKSDLPANQDVLLGKGLVINQHPGNISYRRLIDSMVDDYIGAAKSQKAAMTWRVVQVIEQSGARFLKQQSPKTKSYWWIVATDKEARQKVGKSFVALASQRREQLQNQNQHQQPQEQEQERGLQLREDGKRVKIGF